MKLPPEWLLRLPYASNNGHLVQTDYGWRFFPGSEGTRKALHAFKEAGFTVKRMRCGTYHVEEAA